MKNLIGLAIVLTTLAINSQAQDLDSESQPTFTYQITNEQANLRNLIIDGIIRNTGHTPIDSIFVKVIGYNTYHEIIGTGSDDPVINFSLQYQQVVHFKAEIFNHTDQDIASYSINFDAHSPTTPQPIATPSPMDNYGSPTPTPLPSWVPTPTPGPVTITTVPMTQQERDKLKRERIAKEEEKRNLFEKQEAEREAHGDFSQAPGLTPEQRQAAAIRWAEKNAKETIKGATPAPQ
jgi:hypothetical protein